MASFELPPTMRALEIDDYVPGNGALRLVTRRVPLPGPGQVLVKIAYSPINPSDQMFMQGTYVVRKQLPTIPGTVASGRVVAAGQGLSARFLLGKRVSCAAPYDGNGPWAEYMVAPSNACVPLFGGVSLEMGANLLSNPLTAIGLVDSLLREKHHCFIQNAAAGDIALMVANLAARRGLRVINIVRRAEQLATLKKLGAAYVLDSSAENFEADLRDLCAKLKPTLAIDSVAGSQTHLLGQVLQPGGELLLCGKLSGEAAQIPQAALYSRQLRVRAFTIMAWVRSKSILGRLRTIIRLQAFIKKYQRPENDTYIKLEMAAERIGRLANERGNGKTIISFT